MSPYADFPKSNRISMEWGRETIEMQENGSTKNLLQMTDIYYSVRRHAVFILSSPHFTCLYIFVFCIFVFFNSEVSILDKKNLLIHFLFLCAFPQPALRNSDLERNGLYPFTGLPGSRHSCIYPAQWNPSFISDDSRRRDYF